MVKKVKYIDSQAKDQNKNSDIKKDEPGNSSSAENRKVIKTKTHIYVQEDDIKLSDLEDEDQKRELLDLELQIENEALTRGERRRLQNKRNVLKAKIKKELESETHKTKIYRLQKKLLHQKKTLDKYYVYKPQRDDLKKALKEHKLRLEETSVKMQQYRLQRNGYYNQIQ